MHTLPIIRRLTTLILSAGLSCAICGCGSTAARDNGSTGTASVTHVERGQAFVKQGLDDAALAAFSLALEENPRLVEAHLGVGQIHLKRENYQTASTSYQNAVNIDPSSYDANYYLGLAKQLLGRIDEAIKAYQQAVAIDPESFNANMNLASALLQSNRPDEALPYANRAIDLNPTVSAAYANVAAAYSLLGRYDEAVQAYRDAMELGTPEEPLLLGLADAHIRLGNYDRAINVLRRLSSDTSSSTVLERLGYAQFKSGKYDDALDTYRTAITGDPKDVALLNGYGVCLMTHYLKTRGEVPEYKKQAITSWRQSLRIDPNQSRITDLITRYSNISDTRPKRPKRDDPFAWE